MRILVVSFMSLDGVVQAPNRPEEDTDGGFAHGGWSHRFYDPEVMGPVFGEAMQAATALLFGKHTWQAFAAAWSGRSGDTFSSLMHTLPKYVVSSTLGDEDLTWNTKLIPGDDAVAEISKLHRAAGGELVVLGSPRLVQTLLSENLVDELRLMIEPVLLGGGKRIFPEDGGMRPLELVSTVTAATGVNVCTYRPVKPPTRIQVPLMQQ
ncbi:MAG: dihydrofolate reductase family protein [Gemmatimonadales bacterium]